MTPPGFFNEQHFREIESVMLYLEDSRRRTERAIIALRADDAEPHLVEALERTMGELSHAAKKLRQGTYFAVPDAQLSL
ncbi:MAG: hypothetical protein ACRDOS_09030 [Gaiellaceae bacterium]|jgi:hypothetical protein